ncbi:hypothetical protein R5O87_10890 [Arthrobacter globiformis]|uniref:hypothetical protein n=1 Tax=Arthrobacter globiformis TaxID=1665 RepID=UPI003979C735
MKFRLLARTCVAFLVLIPATHLVSACTNGPAPDPGKRDTAVSSVMHALNEQDHAKLVTLAQPGPQTADPYSKLLLSEWAGVADSGYTASYSSDITPDVVAVRVATTDSSGSPAEVEFSLRWNDKDWVLAVGPDTKL